MTFLVKNKFVFIHYLSRKIAACRKNQAYDQKREILHVTKITFNLGQFYPNGYDFSEVLVNVYITKRKFDY